MNFPWKTINHTYKSFFKLGHKEIIFAISSKFQSSENSFFCSWHESVMKFMRCKASWSIGILTYLYLSECDRIIAGVKTVCKQKLSFQRISWILNKRKTYAKSFFFLVKLFQALFFVLMYQTRDQNKVNPNFHYTILKSFL